MLPSFLTNMFWAQNQDEQEATDGEWTEDAVEHTASEEAGDWLLITTQQTSVGK